MLEQVVLQAISQAQPAVSENITMDTSLSDLGIDSLRAITILYELEEQFDIEIPNELIENIRTVGDIVYNIEQLRQNASS